MIEKLRLHGTFSASWRSALALAGLIMGCDGPPGANDGRDGSGVESIAIDGPPSCPGCRVDLRPIARLGSPSDPSSVAPDAIGMDCSVGRLSSETFVVGSMVGGGEIFLYGTDGAYERSLGSRGEGPGEFSTQVRLIVGPKDTLYVRDDRLGRLTVLSPEGEYVRSFATPGFVRAFALLDNGGILFHPNPARLGEELFQLKDRDGRLLGGFGSVSRQPPETDGYVVAPSSLGGFWTSSIWEYELSRWGSPDHLELTISREVDWFPRGGRYAEGMPLTIPSAPVLKHLWQENEDRIWVFAYVPDSNWEPGLRMDPNLEWMSQAFDTMVEVIDLGSGSALVSARFDRALGVVCGSNLVFDVLETEDGDTRLQVYEPTIIEPRDP